MVGAIVRPSIGILDDSVLIYTYGDSLLIADFSPLAKYHIDCRISDQERALMNYCDRHKNKAKSKHTYWSHNSLSMMIVRYDKEKRKDALNGSNAHSSLAYVGGPSLLEPPFTP
jgi:hypothetical protein